MSIAAVGEAGPGYLSPPTQLFCSKLPDAPKLLPPPASIAGISLQWSEPQLYDAPFDAYNIYLSPGTGHWETAADDAELERVDIVRDADQTAYTVVGLALGNYYTVAVSAVSAVGESTPDRIRVLFCGEPDLVSTEPQVLRLEEVVPEGNGTWCSA